MEDINKYVGIPHYFNQDSFDGCDCIGLCRLFYKEHGWKQDFKDGKPITKDWQKQMVQFVYSGILNKILKKLKILMNFLSEILYCLM